MASQGDIRAFEGDQERRRAPPPALLTAPSPAPATLTPPPASKTPALGAQLPKIVTSSEAMDQAVTGMLGQQKALTERLAPLQAQVEARRAALGGELEKPLPTGPKLQEVPQFQPRQLSSEELTLFAGVAMALAGLGTKAMRGDLTMALNAAGNAMKGFNEGNLQQSKLDIENFKRQMDSVIAQNTKMSQEYRAILENRKLSLQQKDQAMRVAAAARDDQVMLSALQTGQLKMVFDLEAHRINAGNQAALKAAEIYQTSQWRQAQLENRRDIAALAASARLAGTQSLDKPLPGSDLVRYVHPTTGQRPPPGATLRDVIAGGYQVQSTQEQNIDTSMKGAVAMVDRVDQLVNQLWGPAGKDKAGSGLIGRAWTGTQWNLERLTQDNPDVALYDAFIEGSVAPLIRSLGEKGTLTTEDVRRALNFLPKAGGVASLPDSPVVARDKVTQLRELLSKATAPRGAAPAPGQGGLTPAEQQELDQLRGRFGTRSTAR